MAFVNDRQAAVEPANFRVLFYSLLMLLKLPFVPFNEVGLADPLPCVPRCKNSDQATLGKRELTLL